MYVHLHHSLQQASTVTTMPQNTSTTIASYSVSSASKVNYFRRQLCFDCHCLLFLTTIISIFNYKRLPCIARLTNVGYCCRQILHWAFTLPLAGVPGHVRTLYFNLICRSTDLLPNFLFSGDVIKIQCCTDTFLFDINHDWNISNNENIYMNRNHLRKKYTHTILLLSCKAHSRSYNCHNPVATLHHSLHNV